MTAVGWAWRAAGLEYKMRRSAADQRAEWARVLVPGPYDRSTLTLGQAALAERLKRDAVALRATATGDLPAWAEQFWGN